MMTAKIPKSSHFVLITIVFPICTFVLLFHLTFRQSFSVKVPAFPPLVAIQPAGYIKNCNETSEGLPIVVQPVGGIGNQLFQYAAAYTLAKQRNSKLYLCLPKSWSTSLNESQIFNFNALDRSYALNVFNVPQENVLVLNGSRCAINSTTISKNRSSTHEIFFPIENDLIIDKLPEDKIFYLHWSWFESEIFFRPYKNEIRNIFKIRNEFRHHKVFYEVMENIYSQNNDTESVAIHVRRGDFASSNDYRILPLSYYEQAMDVIEDKIKIIFSNKRKVTYFIFSDDIESVKRDFGNFTTRFQNMVFVSNKNLSRICDFLLMAVCKHNIIANSTFSWWAAYLNENKDKLVVAPLPKFQPDWYKQIGNNRFLKEIYAGIWGYPYDWITIAPFK